MGASQRNKGAAGERELFAIFSRFYDRKFKRHLGQARDGGYDGVVGPFIVEAKRRKRLTTLMSWFKQVLRAPTPEWDKEYMPLVAMREDNGEWMVMCRLTDFLKATEDWAVPQLPEPTIEDLL